MTGSPSGHRGPSEADIAAAVEEASRSLGEPDEPPGQPESGGGPARWGRPVWIVGGLLVVAIATALVLRDSGSGGQPAHLVEADLRWAVARVVEHVERERLLRGRLPAESELRLLLGETLTYSAGEGGYRVVGRRDGVRVEYDGSLPIEEWSGLVLFPPDTGR